MSDLPSLFGVPEADDDRIHRAGHGVTAIKVIGVGGAGGNAVDNMIQERGTGVEFMTANTDRQALDATLAPSRLQIGAELTRGRGGRGESRGRAALGGRELPRNQ